MTLFDWVDPLPELCQLLDCRSGERGDYVPALTVRHFDRPITFAVWEKEIGSLALRVQQSLPLTHLKNNHSRGYEVPLERIFMLTMATLALEAHGLVSGPTVVDNFSEDVAQILIQELPIDGLSGAELFVEVLN